MTASTTHPIHVIVELQQTLSRLRAARTLLEGVPDWMRELHGQHTARKSEIEALEQAVDAAARERRATEAAVEDAQATLKRHQEQIGQVRTQREYGALLQEIDTGKQQIKALEQQVFAAMERQEALQREIASQQQSFAETDVRYVAELARWEGEKPGVVAEAEALATRADELRSRLPRGLLAQFERVYERLQGEALARVHTVERGPRGPQMWHCGACNYRVRPQSVVEIRNSGALIQCDSCKRILFFDGDSTRP